MHVIKEGQDVCAFVIVPGLKEWSNRVGICSKQNRMSYLKGEETSDTIIRSFISARYGGWKRYMRRAEMRCIKHRMTDRGEGSKSRGGKCRGRRPLKEELFQQRKSGIYFSDPVWTYKLMKFLKFLNQKKNEVFNITFMLKKTCCQVMNSNHSMYTCSCS